MSAARRVRAELRFPAQLTMGDDPGEYEVEGDNFVGKTLVKDFDGRPYLGQVCVGLRGGREDACEFMRKRKHGTVWYALCV